MLNLKVWGEEGLRVDRVVSHYGVNFTRNLRGLQGGAVENWGGSRCGRGVMLDDGKSPRS
jgi:hypothetical protein